MTATAAGYAHGAPIYQNLGWPGVIPVDPTDKGGVPKGFTGHAGIDVTPENLEWFAKSKPGHNLGLRLPADIIGIDVDNHSGKTGGATIAEKEKLWGKLPYSPRSTSRHHDGDRVSGIRMYHIPAGIKLIDRLPGVEIIQRHHRHVQSWPSIHPDTGQIYEWLGIDGQPEDPPAPDDLPFLPEKWIEGLRLPEPVNGATFGEPADPSIVDNAITEGEMSPRVAHKLGQALTQLHNGDCRHDAMRDRALGLLRCGHQGEPGVKLALTQLRKAFGDVAAATGRDGGREHALTEFDELIYKKVAGHWIAREEVAQLLAQPDHDDWVNNLGEPPPDADDHHTAEWDGEPQPGEQAAGDAVENAIRSRLAALRIDHEARRRLDDETRPPAAAPPVKSLDTLLAEPDTPTRYRIDRVVPENGRVILSAQFKAGKTTLVGNLLRALADNEPFLGAFGVNTPARHAVLIDTEMSENTLRRWLRDQNIDTTEAVDDVIALRGKVSAFNPLDDRRRTEWATRLRNLGCDYLILDPLRPVLDALGLDENRDAGKFLVAYDALLDEAEISDTLIVHHMGHGGERARGDSRLQDWPDAVWRMVRETEEPDSARFFTAFGRDVEVPEGRLTFDPPTRRIRYAPGSRSDAKAEEARTAIVELLAELARTGGDPMSKAAIDGELRAEHPQKAIRRGIAMAVSGGLVTVIDGPRGAKLHHLSNPCAGCGMPVTSGRERHESCR